MVGAAFVGDLERNGGWAGSDGNRKDLSFRQSGERAGCRIGRRRVVDDRERSGGGGEAERQVQRRATEAHRAIVEEIVVAGC